MEDKQSSSTDRSESKRYFLSDLSSSPDGVGFLILNSDRQDLAQIIFENEKEAKEALAAMEVILANAIAFVPTPMVLIRRELGDQDGPN